MDASSKYFLGCLTVFLLCRCRQGEDNALVDAYLSLYLNSQEFICGTRREFIDNLPTEYILENQWCSICLKLMETGCKAMKLPCGHVFCKAGPPSLTCIEMWLLRNNSCPLCRFQVPGVIMGSRLVSNRMRNLHREIALLHFVLGEEM
jgi:hypothetical protein